MVHLSSYYQHLLLFAMIFLGVTVGFCLLRAILGPRFTDRIVAVNIVGTKVIILIGAFAVYFDQDYPVSYTHLDVYKRQSPNA